MMIFSNLKSKNIQNVFLFSQKSVFIRLEFFFLNWIVIKKLYLKLIVNRIDFILSNSNISQSMRRITVV